MEKDAVFAGMDTGSDYVVHSGLITPDDLTDNLYFAHPWYIALGLGFRGPILQT